MGEHPDIAEVRRLHELHQFICTACRGGFPCDTAERRQEVLDAVT